MGWGYWKGKWWHIHGPARVLPFLTKHNSSPVLLVYGWTREGVSYLFRFSYIYIYMNVCVLMPVCMYLCVCIYTHIKIYSTTILFNGARFCSCFVWKTVTTDPSALTCLEWNIICTVITLNIASLKQICPLPCCTACNTVEWNYASFIKKTQNT